MLPEELSSFVVGAELDNFLTLSSNGNNTLNRKWSFSLVNQSYSHILWFWVVVVVVLLYATQCNCMCCNKAQIIVKYF